MHRPYDPLPEPPRRPWRPRPPQVRRAEVPPIRALGWTLVGLFAVSLLALCVLIGVI